MDMQSIVIISILVLLSIIDKISMKLQSIEKNMILHFPLDTSIYVEVQLEILNKNYRFLNQKMRFLLNNSISTGYIKRKSGNLIVFSKTKEFDGELIIIDKVNRFKWAILLSKYFKPIIK